MGTAGVGGSGQGVPVHYVIVPGLDDSGPEHWQSIWQAEWGPRASRIAPTSFNRPDRADWQIALRRAVAHSDSGRTVLVAHSLGCLAVAEYLATPHPDVIGAFLVGPPDTDAPDLPEVLLPFRPPPRDPVAVAGVLVTSATDPWCAPNAANRLAADWALPQIDVGDLGHINAAPGIGRWYEGLDLLAAFVDRL